MTREDSYFRGAGREVVVLAAAMGYAHIERPVAGRRTLTKRAEVRHHFQDADETVGLYSYRVGRIEYGFAFTPVEPFGGLRDFSVAHDPEEPKRHRVVGKTLEPISARTLYVGSLSKPLHTLADLREVSDRAARSMLCKRLGELSDALEPWPDAKAALEALPIVRFATGKATGRALARGRPTWAALRDLYEQVCAAHVAVVRRELARAKRERRLPAVPPQNPASLVRHLDYVGTLAKLYEPRRTG